MAKIKEVLKNKWVRIMLLLGILSILTNSTYGPVLIHGDSMHPYYRSWDIVFVNRIHYKFNSIKRYDIVIIKTKAGERLIKRVVGLGGDKIKIEEGFICLNNKIIQDAHGHGRVYVQLVDKNDKDLHYWGTDKKVINYITKKEITVPKGCVWVVGDNRSISWYGVLPVKNIEGLVIF